MTQYFLPVFYSLLQIIILAGTGFVLRRYANWNKEIFTGISQLLVKITLPAMFISRMSSMNRSDLTSGVFFPFYTFILIGFSFLISIIFAKIFRIPKPSRRVYIALSSFGNVGYIPLALMDIFIMTFNGFNVFFNTPLPSLYIGSLILTYSPILWSLGNYMITGATGQIRIRQFFSPPVIGILTGFILCLMGSGSLISDFSLPFHYIHGAMKTLGSVTSPLILLVLGAMVGELEFSRSFTWEELRFALSPMLLRYGILPASFLILLKNIPSILNLAPAVLLILFLETIVPPPANFAIMTKTAGKNEKEAALSIFLNYTAYLVVLPVYLMIFFSMIRF